MVKEKVFLFKSRAKNKKFLLQMPDQNPPHAHHFGDSRYRDRTLINDRKSKWYIPDKVEREKVWRAYQSRAKSGPIDNEHSPAALSYYILWSGDTLEEGIRNYEKRFGLNVVNRVS
jgi:hypothetical protein|tara:strand:- start:40 stop:387 length:348 start_codon:yes stop_codon:yes gene_type:complete